MVTPFINEDVLMDIFSRLPAKSVGKFRCLSKSWCTNLSTSQFINLHLTTRKNKQWNLILGYYGESFYVVTLPNKDDTISKKVELPMTWNGVVDSCNGLILWLQSQSNMVLVNPITLQHVIVPISSRFLELIPTKNFKCGFGYDSCSGDYKIVMWSTEVDYGTIIEVYSLKSKLWKTVNTSRQLPITGSSCVGVFTNGAIHWASYGGRRSLRIVAFNLADEVFYDIPYPASAPDWDFTFYQVYVLEGCLCVVDQASNDIWIMKEYAVEASWTKFNVNSRDLLGVWDISRPLGFIGDEEIALLTTVNKVIVYNLVEGTSKVIVVRGIPYYPFDGVAFSDSLISPN